MEIKKKTSLRLDQSNLFEEIMPVVLVALIYFFINNEVINWVMFVTIITYVINRQIVKVIYYFNSKSVVISKIFGSSTVQLSDIVELKHYTTTTIYGRDRIQLILPNTIIEMINLSKIDEIKMFNEIYDECYNKGLKVSITIINYQPFKESKFKYVYEN